MKEKTKKISIVEGVSACAVREFLLKLCCTQIPISIVTQHRLTPVIHVQQVGFFFFVFFFFFFFLHGDR
jgi:hypothetical protein